MRVIYSYTKGKDPVFIEGSNGVQRVLLTFYDNSNLYVYYCCDYNRAVYLNKVDKVSVLSEPLSINHLKRIELDSEFDYYINWIDRNYNYSGKHVSEKIIGHDRGGAVLVDEHGHSLYKGDGE